MKSAPLEHHPMTDEQRIDLHPDLKVMTEDLGNVVSLLRACYGATDMVVIRAEEATGAAQDSSGPVNCDKRAATAIADEARRRVLLVDDEWPVRAFVATILQREGFEVIEAGDGLEAFGLLQQMSGAVDVLVTDVRMPRMTGIELVEKTKAELFAMPVVYISGDPLKDRLHDPSSRVIFLQKPFRAQAMLDAIKAVIADSVSVSGFGA
jgi:CheY-like chemotaxis protein